MIIDIDALTEIICSVRLGKKGKTLRPRYITGQLVRDVILPDENYYVSEKAKELWESMSDDNIFDVMFTQTFKVKRDVDLPQYVGSAKEPREIKHFSAGKSVQYRSVFHDEHIVPVVHVVDKLYDLSLEELTPENVEKILLTLVICKILKEEDRKLPRKRFETFQENYDKVYKPNGITLIKK